MYMHKRMCTWCGSVDAVWVCMCMRSNHPRQKKRKSRTRTRGKQTHIPFCIIHASFWSVWLPNRELTFLDKITAFASLFWWFLKNANSIQPIPIYTIQCSGWKICTTRNTGILIGILQNMWKHVKRQTASYIVAAFLSKHCLPFFQQP